MRNFSPIVMSSFILISSKVHNQNHLIPNFSASLVPLLLHCSNNKITLLNNVNHWQADTEEQVNDTKNYAKFPHLLWVLGNASKCNQTISLQTGSAVAHQHQYDLSKEMVIHPGQDDFASRETSASRAEN